MKKKTPKLVTIAVLSLITVLVWFGSEIVRNFSKKPETKVPEEILTPFDPTLDTQTLNKLENSLYFDPSQIQALSTPAATQETQLPTSEPLPTPSPSTEPTTSPSVSPVPTSSP